jgi:hypothetical protein
MSIDSELLVVRCPCEESCGPGPFAALVRGIGSDAEQLDGRTPRLGPAGRGGMLVVTLVVVTDANCRLRMDDPRVGSTDLY